MKESKLEELITNITESEFKKFGEFIHSPFHNKSKKVIELYNFIEEQKINFDSNKITREAIARYVYKTKNYNDQNVRSLISSFTKLLEEFLAYNQQLKEPMKRNLLLLELFKNRGMHKSYELMDNYVKDSLVKEFNRNFDFYSIEFIHTGTELNYVGTNLDTNLDSYYDKMSDTMDKLYIVTKLNIINSSLSRKYQAFGNIKLKFSGSEEIIKYVESNLTEIKKSHPNIYSEFLILMMMLKPEKETYFQNLSKHVVKNLSKYNIEELEEVYYSLTNYCINKIAIGKMNFLDSLNSLYKSFEKNGFYSNLINIQYTDFLSVILSGLHLNQRQWVEYFFEKYKDNISADFKGDSINLTSALLLLSSGKYDKCVDYLNKVNLKNSYFYLKTKETLIKIYYETGDKHLLEPVIDAMRHYLKRRKEVLYIHYERYMNYLKLVNHLIKIGDKDSAELKILKKEIARNPNTIAIEWINQKVEEMTKTAVKKY